MMRNWDRIQKRDPIYNQLIKSKVETKQISHPDDPTTPAHVVRYRIRRKHPARLMKTFEFSIRQKKNFMCSFFFQFLIHNKQKSERIISNAEKTSH